MKQIVHILLIGLVICMASCQRQLSLEDAVARADSLYSRAHVSTDSLPAMRSLLYYQKAINALAGDDTASVGRKVQILSKMGDLLATQMLYREAIDRYQLAYNYSVSLQDTTNMVMAYQCIGDMYRKLHDLGEAVHYYDLAEQLAIQSKQEKTRVSIAIRLASAFMENGKLNLATELLPPSPYQVDPADEDLYNYVMWHIYSFTNHEDKDSANYFLQRMKESPDIYYRKYAVDTQLTAAIWNGDTKAAYWLEREMARLNSESSEKSRNEAIESISSMYQTLKIEREYADLQFKNQQIKLYTAIAILLLIIVIAISTILIYRFRNERLRLERNNALLAKYNADLQADLNASHSKVIEPMADSQTIAIRESAIYQLLLTTEKAMSLDEQAKVETLLNQVYPDFMSRLLKLGVSKEQELKVCLLLKMGYTPTHIASLVSRSVSAIANTRARLYKKVLGKEGSAEDWDKIIQSL